jgi:hypothetical protein
MAGPLKSSSTQGDDTADGPRPVEPSAAGGGRSPVEPSAAELARLKEAQAALATEVQTLRVRLSESNEQHIALEQRVFRAEQAILKSERRAAEERQRLMDQQDHFIAGLVADHERELMAAQHRTGEPRTSGSRHFAAEADGSAFDRPTLPAPMPEVTAAALDRAAQRASEVDWAKLERAQAPTPAATPASRAPIERSAEGARKSFSPDSDAPLKPKPDVSSRPIVSYSLGTDDVEPERLEGAQLSRPPRS